MRTILAVASVITLLAFQQSADRVQALTFRFQNNFWVNLHHLVRGEARRASLKLPLVVPLESLQPDERAAWSDALAAYEDLATKNLIFDRHLVAIDNALAGLAASDVPAGLVDEPIRRALNLAAPVYRLHGWTEQQHTNDAWITTLRPQVERHGAAHLAFPDGLDHAILFYTTGEIMRREFARTGRPDYVPYGDRFDVYKNGWQTFRDALRRDWLPYLEGKAQFDAAVTAVVRDTAR